MCGLPSCHPYNRGDLRVTLYQTVHQTSVSPDNNVQWSVADLETCTCTP